jgi:spartin
LTFSPATQARIRKINTFTEDAVDLSAKTVSSVGRYAQNFGAAMARKGEKGRREVDKDGNPNPYYKPGILNKSMMAFSTIADGIDQAGRNLMQSGSAAATTVVGHKYGPEARTLAGDLVGGARNVGLVYIDALGVTRRAIIKSVAKGMVVGRMPNGQQLVVGAGDGGVVPGDAYPPDIKHNGSYEQPELWYSGAIQPGVSNTGCWAEGFGNTAAGLPAYSPVPGGPFGFSLQGQSVYPGEKR